MSQYQVRLQLRQDTLDNWVLNNPVIKKGEAAITYSEDDEILGVKIGTNSTWIETPYWDETLLSNRISDSDTINFYYDTSTDTYKFDIIPIDDSISTQTVYSSDKIEKDFVKILDGLLTAVTISERDVNDEINVTAVTGSIIKWRINGEEYSIASPVINIPILDTEIGYSRKDLLYLNNNNEIIKVTGVESLSAAIEPVLPPNSIKLTVIDVFNDTVSNTPTPNPDLRGYATRAGGNTFLDNQIFQGRVYGNAAQTDDEFVIKGQIDDLFKVIVIGGATILDGIGEPLNTLGDDGDFYLDTETGDLWGPKTAGVWNTFVSLKGIDGYTPIKGIDYFDGLNGLRGATGLSAYEDWKIKTAQPTGSFFDFLESIKGETGPTGATGQSLFQYWNENIAGGTGTSEQFEAYFKGIQGDQGDQGPSGALIVAGEESNIISGPNDPTNLDGSEGDFYLNTNTYILYGPKTAGVWPTVGLLLRGPKGDRGDVGGPGSNGRGLNKWLPQAYVQFSAVQYADKFWEAVVNTISTDVPGVASESIWKEISKSPTVSNNTSLGSSTTLVPSQNAVKVYVDNKPTYRGNYLTLDELDTLIPAATDGDYALVGDGSNESENGSLSLTGQAFNGFERGLESQVLPINNKIIDSTNSWNGFEYTAKTDETLVNVDFDYNFGIRRIVRSGSVTRMYVLLQKFDGASWITLDSKEYVDPRSSGRSDNITWSYNQSLFAASIPLLEGQKIRIAINSNLVAGRCYGYINTTALALTSQTDSVPISSLYVFRNENWTSITADAAFQQYLTNYYTIAEIDDILTNELQSDILEYDNLGAFPVTGQSGKIYIAINTNITYRWNGSGYTAIGSDLALGTTSTSAFRGDLGQIAYNHSQDVTTNPHNVTKVQVGLGNADDTSDANKPISTATQTALNNKADLVGGLIPANQLPGFVDDVLEYSNLSSFPITGESAKIYIALDTNITYRWGGSSYVIIGSSLALGETSSSAYRGDRGKIGYDHSQITDGNPHGTDKSDVGLSNVDNTPDSAKPVSTIQQAALDLKANLPNELISGGVVSLPISTTIRLSAASWRVFPSIYLTAINTDFTGINPSTPGTQRYVGFYGDAFNTILKVEGAEGTTAAYPTQPANTAILRLVLVNDAGIDSDSPDLSGYLLKTDKASSGEIVTGTNDTKYTTALGIKNWFTSILASIVSFTNTTESTSTSTGAVKIAGGLGILKRLWTKSLSVSDFIGTGTRITAANADGSINALYPVQTPIITNSTIITQLTTAGNWNTSNAYIGTGIVSGTQMQYYSDATYFYYMYDDITPVRILRSVIEATNAESLAGTLSNRFISPLRWAYLKTQIANITNRWQFTGIGLGTAGLTDIWATIAAATSAVGQLRLVQGTVDYAGAVLGTIWNIAGEIKFIDVGGIVNRFQKVYNNALFKGVGTRVAVYNAAGDQGATDLLTEQFIQDTDIVTAILAGSYNNLTNRATITPASSKIMVQGQYYSVDNILYFAVDDNIVLRTHLSLKGAVSVAATAQTTFTVTIGVTMVNTTYFPSYTPTSMLAIGGYITNKTTTTFDVILPAATGTVTFDWIINR